MSKLPLRLCRRLLLHVLVLAGLCVALAVEQASGQDWPQILGPQRNGIAPPGPELATSWPADGPPRRWQVPAGEGVAGVAVVGRRVVLFHRLDGEEVVDCLEAATGKRLWRRRFPTRYQSTILDDSGPRCVPLVADGRVYLYGADRGLRCLRLEDGQVLWQHELRQWITPVEEGYFGAGSSPILVQGRLLVNLGAASRRAGIVAFDARTGRVLWQQTRHRASYSSPVQATLAGVPQVVFVTRLVTLGLDPATGRVLWQVPFGRRGPTVNAANPVVLPGNRVFLTASYGIGARLLEVGKDSAGVLWQRDDVLSAQFTTPVLVDGALYGIHGREDVGVAELRCVDPVQGKVLWRQAGFGKATLIAAGKLLLAQKTDGTLVLLRADPRRYQPLAQARLAQGRVLALPALAAGHLYLRSPNHLSCYDLRK